MTYEQAKALVQASGSFEGCSGPAIADALSAASSDSRRWREMTKFDRDDVRVAAAAGYELGRLGCSRELFRSLNS